MFFVDFYMCFGLLDCPVLEVQNKASMEHMCLVSNVMTNSDSCINLSFYNFTQGIQLTTDHYQPLIFFTSWFLWTLLSDIKVILTHKQRKMSNTTSQLNFLWCSLKWSGEGLEIIIITLLVSIRKTYWSLGWLWQNLGWTWLWNCFWI